MILLLAWLLSPPAWAQSWRLDVREDPTFGGETKSLVGTLEDDKYLFVACDGTGATSVSLLAYDLPYETGDVGLMFHIEIDGESRSAVGEYFATEGQLVGVAYSLSGSPESLVRALAAAGSSVSVRIKDYSDDSDRQWTAADIEGLAESAAGFVEKCFGGARGTTIAVTAAPTAWAFSQSNEEVSAGYRGVMTGRPADGAAYLRITCSLDAADWAIGIFGEDLPFDPASGGYRMTVSVDQSAWQYDGTTREQSGVDVGLVAANPEVAGLLTVLSLAPEAVTLEAIDSEGTSHRFLFDAAGAADAAGIMFNKC